MFLCVLAKADANLGLVRLSIKNVQNNLRDVS
jgi:predicted regulator of Ras-like GTPase activity (Roadblock/LC7/MglB family)